MTPTLQSAPSNRSMQTQLRSSNVVIRTWDSSLQRWEKTKGASMRESQSIARNAQQPSTEWTATGGSQKLSLVDVICFTQRREESVLSRWPLYATTSGSSNFTSLKRNFSLTGPLCRTSGHLNRQPELIMMMIDALISLNSGDSKVFQTYLKCLIRLKKRVASQFHP